MSNWLNANTSKQIPFRVTVGCLLLLILTPIIIPTILTTQVKAASIPSYKYYNSGNDIGAIGGQFGNNTVKLSQTTTGSNIYTGSTRVTVTYNDSFWNWVPFLNVGGQTVTCIAGMQISVNSNNHATGSISTPADLNIPDNTITSQGADNIGAICSAKQASHISDFNQSNISIGGSTSDTTQLGDQPESVVTSQISVGVDSNIPYDKLPSGIKITLSPTTLGNTGTQETSNDLIFSNDPVATQTTFKSVDPGIYKICITPSSIFNFDQCQTVTKTRGTLLIVAFGSPDTVSFSLGKTVKVTVNIKIPSGIKTGTFGPIPIELSNSSGVIKATNTDVYNLDSAHIPADEQLNLLTSPNFDSIEPSTKPNDYKVCIQGTTLCSTFTKEINSESNVTITVPADQSSQFFTAATTTASSCAIEGIGWIVCPVINFLAGIADTAFNFLSDNFLSVNPSLLNTDPKATDSSGNTIGTGAYTAWQTMRTFANVVLVIALLVVIFSQLTSFGITNYGIKKLLPKLIFVAVLINLSFIICQIGVDLSNILGYSLKSLLTNVARSAVSIPDVASTFSWGKTAMTVLSGGTAAVLGVASAGGITLALVALIGMLVSAVIALLMIFFILIVRQMLIVLLVVMAPLAFAAYLLPNTKKWFEKWGKLFTQMLILFPVIGLIFGGSTLASTILKSAWASSGSTLAQIVAAGVLVLPLFLVPTVLKGALNGIGAIGTKIGGLGSQWGSTASRGVTSSYANSDLNKFNQAKKSENAARASAGNYRGSNPFRKLQSFASGRRNESRVFNKLTGGYGASQFLASQGQNRKDMADAISMFNSDDTLIEAWADTGGDIAAANAWVASDGRTRLTDTQKKQMQRMRDAGQHRKATSFLAAASAMSTGGKGSTAAIANAFGNAARAGASATDTDSAWQTSLAAYRASGRGDIVGEMSAHYNANAKVTPLGAGQLRATPLAIDAERLTSWGQVSASSVHRNAIDPGINAAGAMSYQTYLRNNAENTRQALAGYDQMEARAKAFAQPDIITAAQIHESRITGMASTITNIQEAKAYFGVR